MLEQVLLKPRWVLPQLINGSAGDKLQKLTDYTASDVDQITDGVNTAAWYFVTLAILAATLS